MATLADIAKKTGLSIPAVSQILNRHPGYRPETRARVLAVAEQLGYRPHFLGKALASGWTNTVGLITPSLTTPIQVMIIERTATRAKRLGYMTYIATYDDPQESTSLVADLLNHCVDGVILHQVTPVLEQAARGLQQQRVPHVFIDHVPINSPGVVMDRLPGFAQAVEHLAEHGHSQACFLHTRHDLIFPDRRLKPYRKFCRQHRIRLRDETITSQDRDQAVFERVVSILAEPSPPTAWLCGNDEIALATLSAIRSVGFDVPRDFSVVGFNDLPFSKVCWPPLTTIHQPREELSEAATDMLDSMIRGDWTIARQQRHMCCHLVIRGSTGPAPIIKSGI